MTRRYEAEKDPVDDVPASTRAAVYRLLEGLLEADHPGTIWHIRHDPANAEARRARRLARRGGDADAATP